MKKVLMTFVIKLLVLAVLSGENDGGMDMKKRLKPIKASSFQKISGISGIAMKDHIAGINDKGEFTVINIDENMKAKVKKVVNNFPPFDGWELKSDNGYNFIWKTRGRGFYALDIETKKTGHCIVSNVGDDKVINSQLIDPDKKIFMIELSRLDDNTWGLAGFIYVLYDLNNDKIIFQSEIYHGAYFGFKKDYFLFSEFLGENRNIINWYLIDANNKKHTNKLTKKMNEMQIKISYLSKAMNVNQRLILGISKTLNNTYYSVRWDEKFEDIKIEPIILQRPDGNFLDEAFEFSGDGKWVKTFRFPFNNGREMPPELIFFHVSDIYPQGLSLPLLCGYTSSNTSAAFMDHSKYGMCYVQLTGDNTLEVYVLNEGLKILADEVLSGK